MDIDRTYRVEAVRSGDWWAITVPELAGVFSQAKRLDQVEARAREAIALMLDVDEDTVGSIAVHVNPPETVAGLLEALKASVAAAEDATEEAARIRRRAAQALRDEGLPLRDVGRLIGVSHQRVHQLLAS
jgi:predicted RNase H-like HicB family nuclease